MTKLVWDQVGERRFETGVDRGVLYPSSGVGVPWNGLISVEEKVVGGELTPYYFDGTKYLDVVAAEDFQATITAYTYPDEFAECDGSIEVQPGLIATLQPRKRFHFCYRSRIGNDVDGVDHGYKIHLVYNATASPSGKAHTTLSSSIDALNFQWDINAVPIQMTFIKPTPHFIIDSTKVDPEILAGLEDDLYVTDLIDPIIPTAEDLEELLSRDIITEPISEFI